MMDSISLKEEYIKVKIALAKITEEKDAVSTISIAVESFKPKRRIVDSRRSQGVLYVWHLSECHEIPRHVRFPDFPLYV